MRRDFSIGWAVIKLFTVLVYVFMFAPILIVILLSFNSSKEGTFPLQGLSFKWYRQLWDNETIVAAFGTSMWLGVLSAAIATLVGLLAAIALVRYPLPARRAIGMLLVTPLLVPETVLAVGLLLLLRAADLPKTRLLLLAGHVLVTLPFATLVVQAHLSAMGKRYEEIAASLGASRFAVFREITLPLSLPAIIAALLFTFTMSFDNLTASLFWRPSGVETLPTQIFSMLRDNLSPQINALGTLMIVMTVLLSLLAGAFRRKRFGASVPQPGSTDAIPKP